MPPWPKERVARSAPFEYTGLDYLGPFFVKERTTLLKMWICLLTCLSTRAIHLEWAHGLSADQFLNCLRRFVARRGCPQLLISDNAPQFKLVKTVLDDQLTATIHDEAVHTYLINNIRWKFTTELAPWQGGFYEHLVGLVKRSFRKGLGQQLLNRDNFITFVSEVEAVVNSRPLTYVYEDANSPFVLTPTLCLG